MRSAARSLAAWAAVAAGAGLAAGVAVAGAGPQRDARQLKAGVFLYAAPGMGDPNFAETVVLLVDHSSAGSMGLVVNRPTSEPLRERLPGFEGAARDLRFYAGGPVQREAILALVRTNWPSESARRVVADVYLTSSLEDVREALAARDPGRRLRVYSGYAGWGKGQLEAELRAGAWLIDRADARAIFSLDPEGLWERVYSILERLEARAQTPHSAETASSSASLFDQRDHERFLSTASVS